MLAPHLMKFALMKIMPHGKSSLSLLLLPALTPLIAPAQAQESPGGNEQTMVVTASPGVISELDTPAAISVVNGDDMRQAAPRVNLSEDRKSVV